MATIIALCVVCAVIRWFATIENQKKYNDAVCEYLFAFDVCHVYADLHHQLIEYGIQTGYFREHPYDYEQDLEHYLYGCYDGVEKKARSIVEERWKQQGKHIPQQLVYQQLLPKYGATSTTDSRLYAKVPLKKELPQANENVWQYWFYELKPYTLDVSQEQLQFMPPAKRAAGERYYAEAAQRQQQAAVGDATTTQKL